MSKEEDKSVTVETVKDDASVISNKELEAIEAEVLAKDQAAKEALKAEVEAKVRKELEAEQRLKELEAEKAKLEELVKKQAEEKELIAKEKEEELAKVKEQIGSSKAIINHESPFKRGVGETSNFADNLTDEQIQEVNEASKEAFLKAMGITEAQWKGK